VTVSAIVATGCGTQVGASPAPTPADFPGIAGFLGRRGISLTQIASGDAGWLERLLLILLDNAIKFTPRGGQVHVELSADQGIAHLSVTDTGIGIPEDALDNTCIVAEDEPSTLRHHVIDYVVHMRHHLRQILG